MIAYAVGKLLLFAGVYSPHLLALLLRLFSGALSMWAVWSSTGGRSPGMARTVRAELVSRAELRVVDAGLSACAVQFRDSRGEPADAVVSFIRFPTVTGECSVGGSLWACWQAGLSSRAIRSDSRCWASVCGCWRSTGAGG